MNPRLALIMAAAALCSTASVATPSTEPEVDPRPRKPKGLPDDGARITRHRRR